MNRRQTIAALVAPLLALAACSAEADGPGEPPLAGSDIGGAFELVDADGAAVTDQSFDGQWRLVYFGFTFCPDICPVDVQRMGQVMRALEAEAPDVAAAVQPIFITVDPARDTPEAAQAFAAGFHPKFVGLSGSEAQVQGAVDAFRVYRAVQPPRDDGYYVVDHSAYIYLLDADGNPVNYYERGDQVDEIVADIRKWVTA